jgi:hypothetical protein
MQLSHVEFRQLPLRGLSAMVTEGLGFASGRTDI